MKGKTMYKIDDYIMYSTTGVCKITDIKQGKLFNDVETEYYVLCPVFDNNPSYIRVSVDNKKVKMRRILSENDVVSLIDNLPSLETKWINDNKLRCAKHKEYLLSGKCEEWAVLLKTLQEKKTEKNQENKTLSPTDEATMKSTEKLLFQEFSIALNIPDSPPITLDGLNPFAVVSSPPDTFSRKLLSGCSANSLNWSFSANAPKAPTPDFKFHFTFGELISFETFCGTIP